MPFTLAHPAAALPLRSRLGRLGCASALGVGSMIPDLVYFLPLGVSGSQSHSLPGLLWFCLPAGVAGWVGYRLLLRPFAVALVPTAIARRLGPANAAWSATDLVPAAVSVVVGAVTHVAWDSFTHSSGFAVQALPALRLPVHLVDGYTPQVFTLLQHASTLAGLSVLAAWGVRWYLSARASHPPDSRPLPSWLRGLILMALVLPSVAAGLLVLWPRLSLGESSFRVVQQTIGRAIFSAGTVFLTMLMLTALAWRLAWRSRLGERRGCPTNKD